MEWCFERAEGLISSRGSVLRGLGSARCSASPGLDRPRLFMERDVLAVVGGPYAALDFGVAGILFVLIELVLSLFGHWTDYAARGDTCNHLGTSGLVERPPGVGHIARLGLHL